MSAERKRRNGFRWGFELVCLILIAVLAAVMMWMKTSELRSREKEYRAREQLLEQQINEQTERTDALNEKKKYVKTDQYIEQVAREKLGLINPEEVLFKEREE